MQRKVSGWVLNSDRVGGGGGVVRPAGSEFQTDGSKKPNERPGTERFQITFGNFQKLLL